MGAGRIIDTAIQLYREHWRTLVAVVAWPLVPFALLQSVALQGSRVSVPSFNPAGRPTLGTLAGSALPGRYFAILFLFLLAQYLVITPLLTAAVARASADIYLGRPASVREIYRAAFPRLHSILWVLILALLMDTTGYVLLIVPGLILQMRLIVAPITVMLEGAKGTKAIGRSWRLTRGFFWKALGLVILSGLMGAAISGMIGLIPTVVAGRLGGAAWVLRGLGSAAGLVIVTPFTTIVLVLLYFDLRIRKEAFDLAILAQQLGLPPAGA